MAETLRDKVLQRLREALAEAENAERPPWEYHEATGLVFVTGMLAGREQYLAAVAKNEYHDKNDPDSHANGYFIASARTLLPALLSEAQRQVERYGTKRVVATWARALSVEE